jgi:S-adenosylmethionine:tRNA ribosyltransferase-isomerase
MEASLFDYELPEELIAQEPVEPRDASRLLVVHRATGVLEHRHFYDLPDYLQAGDTLVLNDTRVSARRLFGHKPTGGRVELLLLRPLGDGRWHALVRPGRRLPEGSQILLDEGHTAQIEARLEGGIRLVRFTPPDDEWLQQVGQIPLPPYIHRQLTDPERYQTVYAQSPGSAAAPDRWAALHAPTLGAAQSAGCAGCHCDPACELGHLPPAAERARGGA